MNSEKKREFLKRLEELRSKKISAECGYASKEEMLSISKGLIDLCSEILNETTTDS